MKIKLPFYKYDKQTLKYTNFYLHPRLIIKILMGEVFIVLILTAFMSITFNTPKEVKLKSEIASMRYNFFILNKKTDDIIYLFELLEQKDSIIYNSIFQSTQYPDKFESGHISDYEYVDSSIIFSIGNKLSEIEHLLEKSNYRFRLLISEINKNEDRLSHTPAIQPISNKDLKRTSSGFGMRYHPILKIRKMHNGMDFVSPIGTPIYATADGKVQISSESFHGYGKYVRIDHGYGYKTAYAHLNELKVKVGQTIKRGDIIGTLGNTGLSTGPHLHYEVIYNNKFVDPINHYFHDLSIEQYEEMLIISNSFQKTLD